MSTLAQKLQKFKDISVKLALSERFQEALKMCDAGIEMIEASAERETESGIKWLAALHSAKGSTYMAQKNLAKIAWSGKCFTGNTNGNSKI
mgnify:CR=1 FL=1